MRATTSTGRALRRHLFVDARIRSDGGVAYLVMVGRFSFAPEGSLRRISRALHPGLGVGGTLAGVSGGVLDLAAHRSGLVFLSMGVCAVGVLSWIGIHLVSPGFLKTADDREPRGSCRPHDDRLVSPSAPVEAAA